MKKGALEPWLWAAAVIAAFAVYLAHAAVFRDWIVDDAGISYAYARSLASGDGLVAQAGAEPVEGFTNLLWTLLLAVTMTLGLFDPVLTPKLLSAAAVLGSFALICRRLAARSTAPPSALACAAAAVAGATPFVVWTSSGLENALYVFILSALWLVSASAVDPSAPGGAARPKNTVAVGALALLAGLTRPEGILFLAAPAFVWGSAESAARGEDPHSSQGSTAGGSPRRPAAWARAWATFSAGWLVTTGFRLVYFGDLLPNTYYAKKGPGWRWLLVSMERFGVTATALAFLALTLGGAALGCWLAFKLGQSVTRGRAIGVELSCLAAFATVALFSWKLLPTDWMPEYRFATPLFFFLPFLAVAIASQLPRGRRRQPGSRLAVLTGIALLVVALGWSSIRTPRFARSPAIALSAVEELSARIADAALAGGVARPLVAMPDVGGALWADRFWVLDLAGLTDRELGRALRRDAQASREQVLGGRRPDLIWTHPYWTKRFDWTSDQKFSDTYVLVWSSRPAGAALDGGALFARSDLAGRIDRIGKSFAAWARESAGLGR